MHVNSVTALNVCDLKKKAMSEAKTLSKYKHVAEEKQVILLRRPGNVLSYGLTRNCSSPVL